MTSSTSSERESVIRVALAVLNGDGWSTEYGRNSTGFVLTKEGERLLVVGHGRWNVNSEDREQLYGRLLKLYSRYPEAVRGVVVLPASATEYTNEVSKEVRVALGIELALVDPAAGTIRWLDVPPKPRAVNLDEKRSESAQKGGRVVARLRRIFS